MNDAKGWNVSLRDIDLCHKKKKKFSIPRARHVGFSTKVQAEINVNGNVIADDIKEENKREKEQIKASFYRSLEQIKEEFANEITLTTETMQTKHKKEMGKHNFDYKL